MQAIRNALQHRFNPMHVYCRLRNAGFTGPTARRLSALYERFLYPYNVCS